MMCPRLCAQQNQTYAIGSPGSLQASRGLSWSPSFPIKVEAALLYPNVKIFGGNYRSDSGKIESSGRDMNADPNAPPTVVAGRRIRGELAAMKYATQHQPPPPCLYLQLHRVSRTRMT